MRNLFIDLALMLLFVQLELNNYKEARLYLTIGLGKCPDSKFLKVPVVLHAHVASIMFYAHMHKCRR